MSQRQEIANEMADRAVLRGLSRDFEELKPTLRAIQRATANLPMAGEDAVSHLAHDAIAIQYVYYVNLVRRVLGRVGAQRSPLKILDWGGAYGHVTALLHALGFDATDYLY